MTSCVRGRRKADVLLQQLLTIVRNNSNRQEGKDKIAREFQFADLIRSLREAYMFELLDTVLDLHLFLLSQNQDLTKFCVKIRNLADRYSEWYNVPNELGDWPL
jgi:hypothetical protein